MFLIININMYFVMYKCLFAISTFMQRNSPVASDPDIHTLRNSDMHFAVTFPLTHIFCGQINGKGEAEGFHSRPNSQDPPRNKEQKCASVRNKIFHHVDNFGFPAFKGVQVYNTTKWIPRKVDTLYYGFFPNQWTVSDVVNKISKCVSKCCSMKMEGCRKTSGISMCLYNFTQSKSKTPFAVQVFLTLKYEGEKNKKQEKMPIIIINSAFPVRWKKTKKGIMDDCKNGVRCDSHEC